MVVLVRQVIAQGFRSGPSVSDLARGQVHESRIVLLISVDTNARGKDAMQHGGFVAAHKISGSFFPLPIILCALSGYFQRSTSVAFLRLWHTSGLAVVGDKCCCTIA